MNNPRTVSALLLAAVAMVGCEKGDSPSQAERGHGSAEATESIGGISFSEKSGLIIPAETAEFIGLQIADVEEREVKAELRFAAQVYRAAKEAQFASATPMVSITAWASAQVSPGEASLLSEGQPISVEWDDQSILPGRISRVDRSLELAGGQVEVLIAIVDRELRLRRGSFVSAIVPLGGGKSVTSVPRSALLRTTDGDFVYTVSGEAFARARVTLGAVNGDFAEITDGLYPGDQVVVKPAMTLWLAEIQALRGGKSCAHGH